MTYCWKLEFCDYMMKRMMKTFNTYFILCSLVRNYPFFVCLSSWFCRCSIYFLLSILLSVSGPCVRLKLFLVFGQKKSRLHQSKYQATWSKGKMFYLCCSNPIFLHMHFKKMPRINIYRILSLLISDSM